MKFDEYRKHDATGLAALVAANEVTPTELLEVAIARMEAVNPKINAVCQDITGAARAQAAKPSSAGNLAGVPFLLKDLGAAMAGTVSTSGSALLKDNLATSDSAIVEGYKQSGLVIFGRTNTPEMGLLPVTESSLLGVCRNPWDLSRTPGGSSGGAASAVAAGIVPAAHASDGGGSIRTPASVCGLFGMKPSRGRVSFAPMGEGWGGASIQHAVTRSVRDSAALLDAVCAPRAGDPYFLAAPDRPYAETLNEGPGRLKIAVFPGAMSAPHLDPECAAAVQDAARLCESLGHDIEEVTLPGDLAAMQLAAGNVISASVVANVDAEAARRGRPVSEDELEPLTWGMYRRGKGVSGGDYVQGLASIHAYGRAMAGLFERYDVLLLSTLGCPAIPIGWLAEDTKSFVERLFYFMPNTQAFNNTGQPAMSVPLAWSQGGLPIGLQFVGRMGDETTLFQLARQLETARPWFDRVPSL